MASSHRKPRPRILATAGPRAAVGITTAALASVTLLSESASAAPAKPATPSITEVKAQVDALYEQTEVATMHFDDAKEKTAAQRTKANQLLAQVAQKTQKMNETRRVLGQFATAQYRDGGLDETTQLLLSDDPEKFLDQSHMLDRLSTTQEQALETFKVQQAQTSIQRAQAAATLKDLTTAQAKLATQKKKLEAKLATADKLLKSLTAKQKAQLAALEHPAAPSGSSADTTTYTYNGPASGRATQAINFALAQQGKPYVRGATGPNSYDCSGLTQAAYRSAGIRIGRTTWDQIKDGTPVTQSQLRPGDLVFFYSGISHVAIYLGDGRIVHAPHTGAVVEIGQLSWMPFAGAVRLA